MQFIAELQAFFQEKDAALSEVLDATGCREGWLQGELYRWFSRSSRCPSFRVNSLRISRRQVADFDADSPVPLVGEVKIIGASFQAKCITGGSLEPVLRRLPHRIAPADRHLALGAWGLIPDFFRLFDFATAHGRAAYLVLVAAEGAKERAMSRALREIDFINRSSDLPFRKGMIRIWKICASPNEPPGGQLQ